MTKSIIFSMLVTFTAAFLSSCKGGRNKDLTAYNLEKPAPSKQSVDGSFSGPTFEGELKSVFSKNCMPCHGPGSPQGDWTNYKVVFAKKDLIKKRIYTDKNMPLGRDLDDKTRKLIADWVDNGAVEKSQETPASSTEPVVISPTPQIESNITPPAEVDTQSPKVATYIDTIKPLFESKCSACHNTNSSIPNWLDYDIVVAKKELIINRIFIKKDMPMGFTMSDSERELVNSWINDGLKYDSSNQPNPTPVTPIEPSLPPATNKKKKSNKTTFEVKT